MAGRLFTGLVAIAAALGLVAGGVTVGAQTTFEPPRLPDGKPDLQGVWDFSTLTPLERPLELGDKAKLEAEEAAQIETAAAERLAAADAPAPPRTEPLPAGRGVGTYNIFWIDQGARVVHDQRTSLIVDPSSGRLPDLQPGVLTQAGSLNEDIPGTRPVRLRSAGIGADSYEDRGIAERCIVGFNSGPPIIPVAYNQNIQVFQNEETFVILNEMVHDARIVPLDGRDHLPDDIRQWMGDARGYWDGDTLVVESRNFTDKTASFNPNLFQAVGTGSTLHLTERFSLVAEDTLLYEFTVNDPTTYTAPFTAALSMRRGEAIFEYACHEGNYGMANMLSGARAAERDTGSEQ